MFIIVLYVCVFSDDMLIKLWDWDRKWSCSQVFEGHTHYVMEIVINPKDNNQFASASLDRTIKVYKHTHTCKCLYTNTHKRRLLLATNRRRCCSSSLDEGQSDDEKQKEGQAGTLSSPLLSAVL